MSCAEIILCRFNKAQYNGEAADVWSAGVMLYLMLTGTYPFEDKADPNNFSKVVQVRRHRPPPLEF